MKVTDPDPFSRRLHLLLRRVPDLAAPPTLESRVNRAIAQRLARPWWRRPFSDWPMPARAAFVLLSFGSGGIWLLPILAKTQLASAVASWVQESSPRVTEFLGMLAAALPRFEGVLGNLGMVQLIVAASIFTLCALLFALGTAAYRLQNPAPEKLPS